MSDDRPSASLTPTQRAFLRGEKTYTGQYAKQQRYDRRQEIKKRVWNSFIDGNLLFTELPTELRREVFSGWEGYYDSVESSDVEGRPDHFGNLSKSRAWWAERIRVEYGFSGWLAFLYLGLAESDDFDFERLLRSAVSRAEQGRDRDVVDFEFRVDTQPQLDLDELAARFEQREVLTTRQLKRLRDADEITGDDLATYYDELNGDTGGYD